MKQSSRSTGRSAGSTSRSSRARVTGGTALASRTAPDTGLTVAPEVVASPAAALGWTGTGLDTLPMGTLDAVERTGSTAPVFCYNTRTFQDRVTLFVRLITLQPMLAQSLAGNNSSSPTTDHCTISGKDRFWLNSLKVRGCVRTQVLRGLGPAQVCSDAAAQKGGKGKHCGQCFKCRLFGCFDNDGASRIVFSDFFSEQTYAPITLCSNALHTANPFTRTRTVVPPGVAFQGLLHIKNPSKLDLATAIAALELAAQDGFGSDTASFGRCQVEILGIAAGSLSTAASAHPVLEAVDQGLTPVEAVRATLARMPRVPDAMYGPDARDAADRISRLSPMSPGYGIVPI